MRVCALVLLPLVVCTGVATADETAANAREVMANQKSAVVTIQLVLKEKYSMPGMASQDSESTSEATGTVISPEGLTVLSLVKTDPTGLLEAVMPQMGGSNEMSMSTEVEEVRFLMESGAEIPAEVVLRDKDLDMAFVRPKEKPEVPFEYVDLSQYEKPELLQQLVRLNRLGKVSGRAYAASLTRVEAIVERPRTYFVPEGAANDMTHLGTPAFTLDGKVVGVTFLRVIRSTGGGGGMSAMTSGLQDVLTTVILPAGDIADSAAQVPPFE